MNKCNPWVPYMFKHNVKWNRPNAGIQTFCANVIHIETWCAINREYMLTAEK